MPGTLRRRFEVGVQTGVRSAFAKRDDALHYVRALARAERVDVILHDRLAKRGAANTWLFREDGACWAIIRRESNGTRGVH